MARKPSKPSKPSKPRKLSTRLRRAHEVRWFNEPANALLAAELQRLSRRAADAEAVLMLAAIGLAAKGCDCEDHAADFLSSAALLVVDARMAQRLAFFLHVHGEDEEGTRASFRFESDCFDTQVAAALELWRKEATARGVKWHASGECAAIVERTLNIVETKPPPKTYLN